MQEKESVKNKIIEFYNKYSVRQQRVGINVRHKSIIQKLKTNGLKKHHHVLEIGCGIGTLSTLLIKYLKKGRLKCIDISPENIRIAKANLSKYKNIELLEADATEFYENKKYDVIVLPDVIEHIPLNLHNKLFLNLSKLINENGFIFIHIPNPDYLEWCHSNRPDLLQVIDQPIHTNLLIENTFSQGFVIKKMETYSIWVKNGDYQYIILCKRNKNYTEINQKKIL